MVAAHPYREKLQREGKQAAEEYLNGLLYIFTSNLIKVLPTPTPPPVTIYRTTAHPVTKKEEYKGEKLEYK